MAQQKLYKNNKIQHEKLLSNLKESCILKISTKDLYILDELPDEYINYLVELFIKNECGQREIIEQLDWTKFINLTTIDIFCCHFKSLPILPKSVKKLNCSRCFYLKSLSNIESIDILDLELIGIGFKELPKLPDSIVNLDVSQNLLMNLTVPASIKLLICKQNCLKKISDLPAGITQLDVSENHLSVLPELKHTQLTCLNCSMNDLTSIPKLPDTLVDLNCSHNYIECLSDMPNDILYLDVSHNKLTDICELNYYINKLHFHKNSIKKITSDVSYPRVNIRFDDILFDQIYPLYKEDFTITIDNSIVDCQYSMYGVAFLM